MTERQEERLITAVEQLADAWARLATVEEGRYSREYPKKLEVSDVTITRIPTDEDRAREDIGGDQEPLSRWLTNVGDDESGNGAAIGPRERAFQQARGEETDEEEDN